MMQVEAVRTCQLESKHLRLFSLKTFALAVMCTNYFSNRATTDKGNS